MEEAQHVCSTGKDIAKLVPNDPQVFFDHPFAGPTPDDESFHSLHDDRKLFISGGPGICANLNSLSIGCSAEVAMGAVEPLQELSRLTDHLAARHNACPLETCVHGTPAFQTDGWSNLGQQKGFDTSQPELALSERQQLRSLYSGALQPKDSCRLP